MDVVISKVLLHRLILYLVLVDVEMCRCLVLSFGNKEEKVGEEHWVVLDVGASQVEEPGDLVQGSSQEDIDRGVKLVTNDLVLVLD
jgi:hypothetical protein